MISWPESLVFLENTWGGGVNSKSPNEHFLKLYYAAYVSTTSQGGDRASNPIITYKLQRSTLYTIHEIK